MECDDQMECDGDDEVDETCGEPTGPLDEQIKEKNGSRTTQHKTKSNKQSNSSRKKPDQDLIHKYAKMLHNPAHKHVFDALNGRLKSRVLKFIDEEEKLRDFCRRHDSPYEEPTTECDYTRKQRMKCRIKYHVKKKSRNNQSHL